MEQKNSAKFAFYYLLSLVALLFMSISVGMIIFQVINKYIFDALEKFSEMSQEPLKFAISALIISAPLFYVTMRQIFKNLNNGNLDKDAAVRRWLTYFVLLISSIVMIFWLITTIQSYLNGELSFRSILKTLTVLGIAASIFSFYLYDIKRIEVVNKKDKVITIFTYVSMAVVIIFFGWSLFIVESPTVTRERKLDNTILNRFDMIDGSLNNYYYNHGKLPASFAEINKEGFMIESSNLLDPITNKEFEYKIISDKEYQLCANFIRSNKNDTDTMYTTYKERWPHDSGYQCLSQKITNEKGIVVSNKVFAQ